LRLQGELHAATAAMIQAVEMWRRIHDDVKLSNALTNLAVLEQMQGNLDSARCTYQEAADLARQTGERRELAFVLNEWAGLDAEQRRFERSLEAYAEAGEICDETGDEYGALITRSGAASTLLAMGRVEDAYHQMRDQIPQMILLAQPDLLVSVTEDYASVLLGLGHHLVAARLLGASDAMRERNAIPRIPRDESAIENLLAQGRSALPNSIWEEEYNRGRTMTVEAALTEANTHVSTP